MTPVLRRAYIPQRGDPAGVGLAATRLAIQRGLDNVLVEDIAAEVGVTTRTFNNYSASKHEAICALAVERAGRIGEALRTRPGRRIALDAITHAVLQQYAGADQAPEGWKAGIRLVTSAPTLQGEYLKAHPEGGLQEINNRLRQVHDLLAGEITEFSWDDISAAVEDWRGNAARETSAPW